MSNEFKNYQMFRADGRNVFMEVMSSMIDKGKIVINFIQYDKSKPVGKRQGNKIAIYIDLGEAKNFFYQASIGGFEKEAERKREAQKKGGYKYAQAVYQSLGGTPAETLKKRGQSRKDGKPEARIFELTPGDRKPWVLQAKVGGGKMQPNGLISMDGRQDYYLMIAMDDFEFRTMGVVVYDHIRLIETKLALGGDCDIDSKISIGNGGSSDRISELEDEINKVNETCSRILNGVGKVYKMQAAEE